MPQTCLVFMLFHLKALIPYPRYIWDMGGGNALYTCSEAFFFVMASCIQQLIHREPYLKFRLWPSARKPPPVVISCSWAQLSVLCTELIIWHVKHILFSDKPIWWLIASLVIEVFTVLVVLFKVEQEILCGLQPGHTLSILCESMSHCHKQNTSLPPSFWGAEALKDATNLPCAFL